MVPNRWFIIFFLLSLSARAQEAIVHTLVPGFTVQELPVKLSNINNLRFTPEGRLSALGYDGRIHILTDTNGDGLEDKAEPFWDKSTLSVPVGMCWSPEGLYVSSKGKVSLFRDHDADGKADHEEIIASGWPPTDVGSGGVDATAVTRDKEGDIYFGLLTADYSNPYRVTKEGKARYNTNYARGTIQKWTARTKTLQSVATGIRVPYTLAFNRHGDLFVTDQEGETWCPGGNPLDELNHIIPGKNYGFPPRHPQHLPDLVSESPVIGFGPQHQSTCGFVFNESSRRQKRFGPKWWEGDAFVAGQSRGKIWRVRLIKTPQGYIGKAFIFARLSMLTTDVAISPKGDLYVSCHSGPPDWGTGPKGPGKIFKISYSDTRAPQPIYTWAANQMEVRVAFDRAIDSSVVDAVTGKDIEFGEYVAAGDRYEKLKPPYEVVKHQLATPRGKLKIVSAVLQNENHTLVLKTGPHPLRARYALTLPSVKARKAGGAGESIDLEYDLNGVTGMPIKGGSNTNWLPHPDARLLSALFADAGSKSLTSVGNQAGADGVQFKLTPPPAAVKFRFSASKPFQILAPSLNIVVDRATNSVYAVVLSRSQVPDGKVINVLTETGNSPVSMTYFQENDETERPLPLASFQPDWAPDNAPIPFTPSARVELSGGDFQRGKNLFFGEKLKCAGCHRIRGEGNTNAPDLSNLAHRDVSSVLRDIREPNAAINPDYTAFNAELRDGEMRTGYVRAQEENSLQLIGVDGVQSTIRREELAQLRASAISLMPEGLLDGASEKEVRDLLVFLTSEPPRRSRSELETILSKKEAKDGGTNRTLNMVWVAGKQDHGPGEHDYPAAQKMWLQLLAGATNVFVTNAWQWPTDQHFASADLLIFYFWNKDWSEERFKQIDSFLARGGGVVALHSATISDKEPEKLAERFGLAAQPARTKYVHAPVSLKIDFANVPLTRNLPKQIRFLDEPYWPMIGDPNKVKMIATADLDGKAHPQIWTFEKGKGRVFASIMGHYTWTHEDPFYRLLVLRGMAWAAGVEPGPLEKLALPTH